VSNPFSHECDVCDRLWFLRDQWSQDICCCSITRSWGKRLQISSRAVLAENHWTGIRFQTCWDWKVSSIHQSPANCYHRTHSVHSWFHHVCHSCRFTDFVTRATTA
jgi:hypothetical protein